MTLDQIQTIKGKLIFSKTKCSLNRQL